MSIDKQELITGIFFNCSCTLPVEKYYNLWSNGFHHSLGVRDGGGSYLTCVSLIISSVKWG